MMRTVHLSRVQLEALRHFMSARAYVAMYKIVDAALFDPTARTTARLQRFWAQNLRVVVPLQMYSLGMEEQKAESIMLTMDTSMHRHCMEALQHSWSMADFPVETPQEREEAKQELLVFQAHQAVLAKIFDDAPMIDPQAPAPNIFHSPQVIT